MTLFLAVRLLLKYSNAHNPNVEITFRRLSQIVEEPLRSQILKTIEWMQKQKKDDRFVHHMNVLTDAWMKGIPASIRYQSLGSEKAEERVIEPYFIEPGSFERANYVVGYCRARKEKRTFKIERIESARLLPNEKYKVPDDFDANRYLGSAWGITVHGEAETVKLRFSKELARVARETEWHPSQATTVQKDGTAVVTMTVTVSQELVNFITGWGDGVEVLEPASLREKVAATARAMVNLYAKKK
jgi:predicted DNA-binding transcriptional regulator YafY